MTSPAVSILLRTPDDVTTREALDRLRALDGRQVLTLDPVPGTPPAGFDVANLHEQLRTRSEGEGASELPDPGSHEDDVTDGYTWRRRSGVGSASEAWDYLRPDGSRYLRTPPDGVEGDVFSCGSDGRPVRSWSGLGGLWRWWVDGALPATGRVVLLTDDTVVGAELGRLHDPRVVLVHRLHGAPLSDPAGWWLDVDPDVQLLLDRVGELDALVVDDGDELTALRRRIGDLSQLELLDSWPDVVERAVGRKRRRRVVTEQEWTLEQVQTGEDGVSWSGTLDIRSPFAADLDTLVVTAQAWSPDHGAVVDLPQQVHRTAGRFRFEGRADAATLRSLLLHAERVRVRVGYTWEQLGSVVELTTEPIPLRRRRWF